MKKKTIKLDYFLLLLTLILSGIGLAALYSATNTLHATSYVNKQLLFLALGLLLLLITALTPLKVIIRLSYGFYALSLLLLILVFFFGVKGYGAERWLYLGSLKLQPSEPAKLATVLAVARYLSNPEVDINRPVHFLTVLAIILTPFLLIARQPDLGTSLVFLTLIVPMLYWAGIRLAVLLLLISPLFTVIFSFQIVLFVVWLVVLGFLMLASFKSRWIVFLIIAFHIGLGVITPKLWDQLRPYQKQRILTFANPEKDPKGSGYQIIQSKVAIGSGGLWGKGYLKGSQTQLRFLPAQHTDFIFSVIGEEWGFLGVMFILLLFLILLLYLINLASVVKAVYSSLATIGLATILFFHIIVNIAMTVGLAPVTGLPLPFISYGGSFLITMLLLMGMLINFSVNRLKN